MHFQSRPQGVSAIVTTIFLGSLLMITLSSVVVITLSDLRISKNSKEGISAFHAAESGIERIIAEWVKDPNPEVGLLYENKEIKSRDGKTIGSYSVTVTDQGNGIMRVESVGKSGLAQRKIEGGIEIQLGGVVEPFSNSLTVNSTVAIPSNMSIWGDVALLNGLREVWNNGAVYATDGFGAQFNFEPSEEQAPFGKLEYYITGPDTFRIVPPPTQTNNGDAHGFWQSAQNIHKASSWLNPLHNIGDFDVPRSGQYYNRDSRGQESLDTNAKEMYGLRTGIAIKNKDNPLVFPIIGNGTVLEFAAYYESILPPTQKREFLVIDDLERGGVIRLANGKNNAIIGSNANTNGFPTQFLWNGTGIRDDGSSYNGSLRFNGTTLLYVDGQVRMSSPIAMNELTIISSKTVDIANINAYPVNNFSIIGFDDIIQTISNPLQGVLYTSGTLVYNSNARFQGSIVAKEADFRGGGIHLIYDRTKVLDIQQWIPGGSQNAVKILYWKEVAP